MTTRTVAELLELGTYQGMTDEEIESIMEHKEHMSYESGYLAAASQERTDRNAQMIADNLATGESLRSMVESLVGYQPTLIGGEQ